MNVRLVKNVEGNKFYRRDMDRIAYWLIDDNDKEVGVLSYSGGGLTDDPYFLVAYTGHPKDGEEIRQSEVFKTFGQPQDIKEAIKRQTPEDAFNAGVADAKAGKPRANASDVYGPNAPEYNAGYGSVTQDKKEVNEMSEDVRNEATVGSVINMIRQGNNLKAEEAFKVVMDQKVGAAIRAKTPEVAQSMFNSKKR